MDTPAMLPIVKAALAVTSTSLDDLVITYIYTAKEDLARQGVEASILEDGQESYLVKAAIIAYVQGHFGIEVDKDQAERLSEVYKRICLDLLSHVETGYLKASEAGHE